MTQDIKEELTDKTIALKIQLAILMEKLIERGQEGFARHLYTNLQKMYAEFEATSDNDFGAQRKRMKSISGYLTELENILLACIVGIDLPDEKKAIVMVRTLKAEILQRVVQEEVQMN